MLNCSVSVKLNTSRKEVIFSTLFFFLLFFFSLSVGNWDPEAFVEKFGLVGPVASLQFLTRHFKD